MAARALIDVLRTPGLARRLGRAARRRAEELFGLDDARRRWLAALPDAPVAEGIAEATERRERGLAERGL
jgi:hypothetical protein